MVDEEKKPTIKPITIKPIKITPINAKADTNSAPNITINSNPQQASADNSVSSPTIRLKPISVTPNASPSATTPAAPTPSAAPTIKPAITPINVLKAPAQAPITSKTPTGSMPKVISGNESEGKSTMRIRPPAPVAAPTIKPTIIKEQAPANTVTEQASKGKTSRISLESVMDSTTDSSSPAPVGKLTSHIPDIASSAPKSSTVKIDVTDDQTNTQQVTRKKTLRVKAPARPIPQPPSALKSATPQNSEAKTVIRKAVSIKKPSALQKNDAEKTNEETKTEVGINHIPGIEDESIMAFNPQTKPVKVENVNPIFPAISTLSIIAILVIIVMFLAQAAGPDRSLTKYSSMPDAPEFGFPGKIQIK